MGVPHRSAAFIAEAPGLDFLNSGSPENEIQRDWLKTGESFVSWLKAAALSPADLIDRVSTVATAAELDTVAERARDIREWFRAFVLAHMGQPLAPSEVPKLARLNRLLEEQQKFVQIAPTADGHGLQMRTIWRPQSPYSMLAPVAEALAGVVCEVDFQRIKACEGGCGLLFVDHTRGHARRWCSMATCGNRAKQEARRRRLKRRKDKTSP